MRVQHWTQGLRLDQTHAFGVVGSEMRSRIVISAALTIGVFVALAAGPLFTSDASANGYGYGYGSSGGYKPGWGFGDKNHEHTGPPGQAGKDDDGRPGNGGQNAPGDPGESGDDDGQGQSGDDKDNGGSGDNHGNGKDNAPGQVKKQESGSQGAGSSQPGQSGGDESHGDGQGSNGDNGKSDGNSGSSQGNSPGKSKKG